MSSNNFWFEHQIDAFLLACSKGTDWRAAVAEAEKELGDRPRRVLTRKDLKNKGIAFSHQHIRRKVIAGTFPRPFKLAEIEV